MEWYLTIFGAMFLVSVILFIVGISIDRKERTIPKKEDTISDEDFKTIRRAQKAIMKLEHGQPIMPNSDEHEVLTWAVLKLTVDNMIGKLTGKDLKRAKKVAKDFREHPEKYRPKE